MFILIRYAIRSCNITLNSRWLLFQSGSHSDSEVAQQTKSYDIPLVVKEILKQMLEEDSCLTAKKLLTKVTILREENSVKPINEKIKKYSFDAKLLPNLVQVNISIN